MECGGAPSTGCGVTVGTLDGTRQALQYPGLPSEGSLISVLATWRAGVDLSEALWQLHDPPGSAAATFSPRGTALAQLKLSAAALSLHAASR